MNIAIGKIHYELVFGIYPRLSINMILERLNVEIEGHAFMKMYRKLSLEY